MRSIRSSCMALLIAAGAARQPMMAKWVLGPDGKTLMWVSEHNPRPAATQDNQYSSANLAPQNAQAPAQARRAPPNGQPSSQYGVVTRADVARMNLGYRAPQAVLPAQAGGTYVEADAPFGGNYVGLGQQRPGVTYDASMPAAPPNAARPQTYMALPQEDQVAASSSATSSTSSHYAALPPERASAYGSLNQVEEFTERGPTQAAGVQQAANPPSRVDGPAVPVGPNGRPRPLTPDEKAQQAREETANKAAKDAEKKKAKEAAEKKAAKEADQKKAKQREQERG